MIMDFDLLKLIFIRMNDYLEANPSERMIFTWHGGEVCLLGAAYFRNALRLQDEFCSKTKNRIEHQVQSNLTLINQEMIDLFRRLGIRQIGSSFDPIHHIRGFGRNRDSNRYNKKFMEGIRLLDQNAFTWGVIYVVHRQSLKMPLEIFYYLTNLNIRSHPNFNVVKIVGPDPHNLAISGEEFADFLGAIFPVWYRHQDRYPDVQPFSRLLKNVLYKDKSLVCEVSGNCSHHWIYIGPDGETSQCGNAGDHHLLSFGNIKSSTFEEIMNHPDRDLMAKRQDILPLNECKECRFWGICHGGCPLDALMAYGDIMRSSPSCEATKVFIQRYFEPVTGLTVDLAPGSLVLN